MEVIKRHPVGVNEQLFIHFSVVRRGIKKRSVEFGDYFFRNCNVVLRRVYI